MVEPQPTGMTEATARAIIEEIMSARAELDNWVAALGVRLEDVVSCYERWIHSPELAEVIRIRAGAAIGIEVPGDFPLTAFEKIQSELASGVFYAHLLEFPEPSPKQLHVVFRLIESALENLRIFFVAAGGATLTPNRGGRRELLTQPRLREKIREEIRSRRDRGEKLEFIFIDMGQEFGVSNTKIKRIWLEDKEVKELK